MPTKGTYTVLEVIKQLRHANLPPPLLIEIHSEHRADAVVVESLEFLKLFLPQEPCLTSVKKDAQDQGYIQPCLGLRLQVFVRKRVLPQSTESLTRFINALLDIDVTVERLPDVRAKVPKHLDEGNEAAIFGDDDVTLIFAIYRHTWFWEEHAFRL